MISKILKKYRDYKFNKQIAKAPKNLNEAISWLIGNLDQDTIDHIKIDPTSLHFSLGMDLRNKWGLWYKKSPLTQYFNSIGIYHADDMSGIILTSYSRILNEQSIELEKQVKEYQDYWDHQ